MLRRTFCVLSLSLLALAGCASHPADTVTVAPGVTFRRDATAGVQVLDIDLETADVRPVIVAENIERRRHNFIGDSKTVLEWSEQYGAIGGINAGFFGDTYDQVGRRKQIVGLVASNGKVIAPWGVVTSTKQPQERYVRSAVGFSESGKPSIVWATGSLRSGMKQYEGPLNPLQAEDWSPQFAAGCGPHLWAAGVKRVTDSEERLVSPGTLSRAFVAYDTGVNGAHHMVIGRADAMEFNQLATWLGDYFKRTHKTEPIEAMCMDGGPSAQLVYRADGHLTDAEATGVLVPTALLLLPRK